MLPQWIIILGARTTARSKAGKIGKFEARDYRTIENIVRNKHGFQGCTIVPARGYYRGKEEDTVQIIVLEADYNAVKSCAKDLRRTFRQRSVLLVSAGVGEFLT